MIRIDLKGKRIDHAIKEYRQKLSKIGVHRELRDRKFFKKKSAKNREVMKLAKYKNRFNDDSQF